TEVWRSIALTPSCQAAQADDGLETAEGRSLKGQMASILVHEVRDNGKPEPRARLRFVEAPSPLERLACLFFGNAWPVVLYCDREHFLSILRPGGRQNGDRYLAVGPLGRVFQQVTENFLQVFALAGKDHLFGRQRPGNLNAIVQLGHHPAQPLHERSDRRAIDDTV